MMQMTKYASPLRYPGGKAKLTKKLERIIVHNGLVGIDYAEPFAGGAGLALSLLLDGYVSHIHLNDLDTAVFAFWVSTLEETSDLCRMIEQTPVNIDQWNYCKNILSNPLQYSLLELGFATFFLNRTNRSGILEGGIIGGFNQNGKYKMDCRFNKSDLIKRIAQIATRKGDISITRWDGCDFIKHTINANQRDCLTLLDPPYYSKGHELYLNAFNHAAHLELSRIILNELREPWIVTYDDVPEISAMYSSAEKIRYDINYSVSTKRIGREVMYHSPNLEITAF